MRRIIGILGILAILGGVFVLANSIKSEQKVIGSHAQEIVTEKASSQELNFNNQDLVVLYQFIEKPENLVLIPNFDKKEIAKDVFDRERCKVMTNGGFYSPDSKPIGLFITNETTLGDWQSNLLFNGIFSVNFMATPRITTTLPKDQLKIALQTGPVLKANGSFRDLSITSDKLARRVIVGVTGENKALLMAVYRKDSEFEGPMLGDLPDILKLFEDKSKVTLADSINLDGGSASTFYSNNMSLTEASPVGSFLCEK